MLESNKNKWRYFPNLEDKLKIENFGVVVMGKDSRSRGCGFESQHRILNAKMTICESFNTEKGYPTAKLCWKGDLWFSYSLSDLVRHPFAFVRDVSRFSKNKIYARRLGSINFKLFHHYHLHEPVWPDWAIYWTLGNFLKPLATIILPKSPTFLGIFFTCVKIYHLSSEIIFGKLI